MSAVNKILVVFVSIYSDYEVLHAEKEKTQLLRIVSQETYFYFFIISTQFSLLFSCPFNYLLKTAKV